MQNLGYFVVQGFMVQELKLKGNELLIYSIIHGFSQNGQGIFTGRVSYLSKWTNLHRNQISIILKKLENGGLLEKMPKEINGIKTYDYRALTPLSQQKKEENNESEGVCPETGHARGGYALKEGMGGYALKQGIYNIDNIKKLRKKQTKRIFQNFKSSENSEINEKAERHLATPVKLKLHDIFYQNFDDLDFKAKAKEGYDISKNLESTCNLQDTSSLSQQNAKTSRNGPRIDEVSKTLSSVILPYGNASKAPLRAKKEGSGSPKLPTKATEDAKEVFLHWKEMRKKGRAIMDPKRIARIKSRLSQGFSVEELKKVIDNVALSSYHCGENPQGKIYDDICTIFRDAEQVERFLSLAEGVSGGAVTYLLPFSSFGVLVQENITVEELEICLQKKSVVEVTAQNFKELADGKTVVRVGKYAYCNLK